MRPVEDFGWRGGSGHSEVDSPANKATVMVVTMNTVDDLHFQAGEGELDRLEFITLCRRMNSK